MAQPAAPPTARRAQTQEKLMTAAVRVFAERGIIGASVEEICEAAGFTRGAFYSNFGDTDDLVRALLKRRLEEQYSAIERIAATPPAPDAPIDDAIATGLDALQGASEPDPEMIFVHQELMLYAARQPGVRRQYSAYVEECLERFRGLIEELLHGLGQEFTLDLTDAVDLCAAVHQHAHLVAALNQQKPDLRP